MERSTQSSQGSHGLLLIKRSFAHSELRKHHIRHVQAPVFIGESLAASVENQRPGLFMHGKLLEHDMQL